MNARKRALTIVVLLAAGVVAGAQADQDADPAGQPDLTAVVDGNSRFALDLYQQLRQQDGNLFFSPASLSTALAMTYGGARGNTAAEMAKVLHFELPPERLHAAFRELLNSLDAAARERGCRLQVANALWPQRGHNFLPEFLRLGQLQYRAELQPVDFVQATELARLTINTWVEKQTSGKIQELLAPGILTPLTRLVLTNAVYFKGDWAARFDKGGTKPAPFTLLDGSRVDVPLMNQTGEFGYLEDGDLQVLELPYVGEGLSMVVLLPREHDGLPALEKSLGAKKLKSWLSKMEKRQVRVALPRFKMDSQFSLKDVLMAMGMRDAFTDSADLSGMDGTMLLFISAVVHKAFVDVNEEGTEAAAATGVVVKLKAAPTPPPVFRADHPFLFLIRDTQSGSILFLGRVMNPAS